jgi:hypothetical protein
MWREELMSYDEMRGLGWEWQSVDGCMVKAPMAREAVGRNPTDRGKKRDETQFGRRITRITYRGNAQWSEHA